jgi:hypothetical protein
MALAEGSGVYVPPKKKPDVEQIRGAQPYVGAPTPVGIPVHELNTRVEKITLAYQKHFGHNPSPGLVFDLLRAPVHPDEYEYIFGVPKNKRRAIAMGVSRAEETGGLRPTGIEDVRARSTVPEGQREPASVEDTLRQAQVAQLTGKQEDFDKYEEMLNSSGLASMSGANIVTGTITKGIGQVARSLVDTPGGLILLEESARKDISDATRGDLSFQRSRHIGGEIARQTVEDFRHPLRNPGFLFLDVIGVVTAGAGTTARGGAALGKLGAGARAGEVAKTLIKRPAPGTFSLRVGDLTVDRLASDNAFIRSIQRMRFRRMQKALDLKRIEQQEHLNLTGFASPVSTLRRVQEKLFAPEATIRRGLKTELRVEATLDRVIAGELAHVAGPSITASRVFSVLPEKLRRGLTRGENWAIFVKSLDDPTQVETLRAFHQHQIEQAKAGVLGIDVKAHELKLVDLKLAEKALENPSKRLQRALDLTEEVSRAQELIKIEKLGLDSSIAEARIANLGAYLRGEDITHQRASPYVSADKEFRGSVPDSAYEPGYLYHRTSADRFEQIQKEGLNPAKPSGGNPEGVYFGNEPLQATSLAWKYKNSMYLRVSRDRVPDLQERAFGESLTKNQISSSALEYLGKDGLWHPFRGGGTRKQLLPEESFYVPTSLRAKAKKPSSAPAVPRKGQYGIPPQRELAELTHVFTGNAIKAGDIRVDIPHLVAEKYGFVVRAVTLKDMHAKLLRASVDRKLTERHMPIRETNDIPDELRLKMGSLDEGQITGKEAAVLADKDIEALREHYFPKEENIPGIRWVDENIIPDVVRTLPNQPGEFTMLASAVNEPFRLGRLFLRPAYSLNLLGNVGMNMVETVFAPKYIYRAARANKLYGHANVMKLEALVGEGKALSFSPAELSLTKASHGLARAWSAFTDRKLRLANALYWAERKGYKSEADFDRLFKERGKDLVEIEQRANKGMVEFTNLSPLEKNTLRHWIFVYPWVSRSFVWGVRTMMEHPIKTWTASELGRAGEKHIEDELGDKFPEWFRKGGYFPVHTDEQGNPYVVNAQNINSFSTLNEFFEQGKSLVGSGESPYTSGEDLLSPAGEFALHAVTGRDRFGEKYDRGSVPESIDELWSGLPQVNAFKKQREPDTGQDPLERPPFIPGFWNSYGSFFASSLVPKEVDLGAMEARYWRESDAATRGVKTAKDRADEILGRLPAEKRAIAALEQQTAKVVGRPVPKEVTSAISLLELFTMDYAKFAIDAGREPTAAEKRGLEIDRLAKMGKINTDTQLQLRKDLGKSLLGWGTDEFIEGSKLAAFTREFKKDYLGYDALKDWHDERDTILDVAQNADTYLGDLRRAGLYAGGSGSLSQEQKYELGRRFVAYDKGLDAQEKAYKGLPASADYFNAARQRAWLDEQDKSITVGGKKLPSPLRLAWAMKDNEDRDAQIAQMATAGWETLSDFEKELVGKRPAAGVSRGWMIYQAVSNALRGHLSPEDVAGIEVPYGKKKEKLGDILPDALPEGQREIDAKYRNTLARWVDKTYIPGFYKDFLFSEQPKYRRISVLPVATKGKTSKEWTELLTTANKQYGYILAVRDGKADYTITSVKDNWSDYAVNDLYPYLKENASPLFVKEIELMGGQDFLRTLIED